MTSTFGGLANDGTELVGATPADHEPADAVKTLAYAAVRPLLYWAFYLMIVNHLASLDDDVLGDIGIARWDIGNHARRRAESRWPLRRSPRAGLLAVAAALSRALKRGRQRRVAIHDLMALDDRMLKDIGLNRCQIPWVAEDMVRSLNEFGMVAFAPSAAAPDMAAVEAETSPGKRPSHGLVPSAMYPATRAMAPANDSRMLKAS